MALTAALILAAGAGARFAGSTPKMLAQLRGRSLVAHAAEAALESAVGPVYVVTGGVELAEVVPSGCLLVPNPNWEKGLASSLHRGIATARADGAGAVVVALGDQPGISPAAWQLVAQSEVTPIAVATYGGKRGHPVRLAESIWAELPQSGDAGAGSLMRSRPDLVTEVPCSQGTSADVDTEQDLSQFNSPTPSE